MEQIYVYYNKISLYIIIFKTLAGSFMDKGVNWNLGELHSFLKFLLYFIIILLIKLN